MPTPPAVAPRSPTAPRPSLGSLVGLFDRSSEAVIVFDDAGAIVHGNPAALALFDSTWDDFIARDVRSFVVATPAMPDPDATWHAFVKTGEWSGPVRLLRDDGTFRDADVRAQAQFTPGRHMAVLRDETDRRATESRLAEASRHLARSEARFRSALEGIRLHAVMLDLEGRILFMNRYSGERLGVEVAEVIGLPIFDVTLAPDVREAQRAAFQMAVANSHITEHWTNEWTIGSGERIRIEWSSSFTRDADGTIIGMASVGEDVTARHEADAMQRRLLGAIDQAFESIIVTDADRRVLYANPAFEGSSGWRAADVEGRPLTELLGGTERRTLAGRIARRLGAGEAWSGTWELAHRDGGSYREEVTISPVRDDHGTITSFVAVARDVSQLRAMQEALETTARERSVVAAALARLDVRATPEETAQSICDAMIELPGIDIAAVSWFDGDDVTLLGLTAPDGFPVRQGGNLPRDRGRYLRARARSGPWADLWTPRKEDAEYGLAMTAMGLRGVAYAPIGAGDDPVGLVVIGTTSEAAAARIQDQLPAAIEFAVASRTLLAGPMASRRSHAIARRRISAIIADAAFHPVFQPVVEMETGRPIGFEALTRFHGGSAPDITFSDAIAVGLGHDLEAATLTAAIEASWDLPAGPWLSLNVSADFVLDGDRLASIMRRRTRPIVLEITEHVAIDDHEAVRAAVAALGPDVRIAVDDAGAGVANFTHIVNLRPDFVKIDRSLIHDVNTDLTRQALIVGLLHFARATNCWIIAEGVETEAERVTLGDLDINFGQGYLFGRPSPVATWDAPVAPFQMHAAPTGGTGVGRGAGSGRSLIHIA